ncbi:MAG: type II toxin-antitoxin system VapC family toxin [Pseudonocardiales bacterium]|nr:type II toxin-antitoxin system VapC family toxin [Pseudonocardiales bacterium]
MIVLDASVLIAHLASTDRHHDRATQLLLDTADEPLGASPLTLAEVLVGPARADKLGTVQSALHDLDVMTIPLADDAPTRLATLRASTRLRLPDCCVLLAAETAGAAVATFDERLARSAAGLSLDVRS